MHCAIDVAITCTDGLVNSRPTATPQGIEDGWPGYLPNRRPAFATVKMRLSDRDLHNREMRDMRYRPRAFQREKQLPLCYCSDDWLAPSLHCVPVARGPPPRSSPISYPHPLHPVHPALVAHP